MPEKQCSQSSPKANLALLRQKIQDLSCHYNRDPESVSLLAVSKTRSAEEIAALAELGHRAFGENYLQEALAKIEALRDSQLEWHFIGKIQTNKTRQIAENFAWVHTVDRLKVAQRLNDQRPAHLPALKICLQVNSSGEASKGGVDFDSLPALASAVAELPRLELLGLMTLPAPSQDFEQQCTPFRRLNHACNSLIQQGLDLDTLSMGTTADFAAAIAEGATIVRIGTALFGPRQQKVSG